MKDFYMDIKKIGEWAVVDTLSFWEYIDIGMFVYRKTRYSVYLIYKYIVVQNIGKHLGEYIWSDLWIHTAIYFQKWMTEQKI